jgi:hypothetical protein
MSHQLSLINKTHVLNALKSINNKGVPPDHLWSEYWIRYRGKEYQFKFVVEIASAYTSKPLKTTDFTSNVSSRNYIAGLGFHILFKSHKINHLPKNFWIVAAYFGPRDQLIDMRSQFLQKGYWQTDHFLDKGEGKKVNENLKQVQIGDRICIRYIDKRGGQIHIASLGTVVGISHINEGKLDVIWDYNPPQFKGPRPSGPKSGNWWRTIFKLNKDEDIFMIFGERLFERRIARITWNERGWIKPTGPNGKSDNESSHEGHYGYGHEEWLFDTGKLIDGFHYGFLEPVRKQQDAYSGKVYEVWLYSLNGNNKLRYWIGVIKNLHVINSKEAHKAKEIYKKKGWMKEMRGQIIASGANDIGFSDWEGIDLFNVKFRPQDLVFNDPYVLIPSANKIYDQSRYSFNHFTHEHDIELLSFTDDFEFNPKNENDLDDDEGLTSKTHLREARPVQIEYLHKAISKSLTRMLKKQYGVDNVSREHLAGYGSNKIDIIVKNNSKLIFFEIKTYNCLRTSTREAIGQLLEYSYYPDKLKAAELIVVTQKGCDDLTASYFKHLRKVLGLQLYYCSYDLETKKLSPRN